MTQNDRDQVVELLRCAADNMPGRALPFSSAVSALRAPVKIENAAYKAWRRVYNAALADGTHRLPGYPRFVSWFTTLLEAAQRVEEGWML